MSLIPEEEYRAMAWRQEQALIAQKVNQIQAALIPPAGPAIAVYENYLPLQIARDTERDNDNGGYYDRLNTNAG